MREDSYYVERALNGDLDAFDVLVRKYSNRVYAILLRMLQDPEEAKDLTQEVMIKVYHKLSNFDQKRRFSAWLYQIAVNQCLDELRKKKRRKWVSIHDSLASGTPGPEEEVMAKEKWRCLMSELTRLPENYRLVFLLRYVDDLSYQEIGEVLGISSTDVRNWLYRAKQKLKVQFRDKEGILP